MTIATGRNSVPGIRRFFEEIGVEALPILLDPKQELAREMAVLGLPITVLIDPEGDVAAEVGQVLDNLAAVAEAAGGSAHDGKTRILDKVASELHERTPLYIGSKVDVEEAYRVLNGK